MFERCFSYSREICKLINFSPKRKHLFSEKLHENGGPTMGVKPLCPTRWTVRTEALNAVIKQYSVIMETMDEVNRTTHDDYGLRAGGVLSSLEKFETLFGIKLAHLLFAAAEETSKVLQAKDTSVQEAVSAVRVTRTFYQRQRQDEAFDRFFDSTVSHAQTLNIGTPRLPWYKKPPKRYSDSEPHRFTEARDYFCLQYFEGCDLLIGEEGNECAYDLRSNASTCEQRIAVRGPQANSTLSYCPNYLGYLGANVLCVTAFANIHAVNNYRKATK